MKKRNMHFSKSIVLPTLGMIVLGVFLLLSYIQEVVFLDRLLVCSLILSFVFIANLGERLHQSSKNKDQWTKESGTSNNPIQRTDTVKDRYRSSNPNMKNYSKP